MPTSDDYTAIFTSPAGKIGLICKQGKLIKLGVLAENFRDKAPTDALSKKIVAELKRYFRNPKHSFNIDLFYTGTPFQQKVWNALKAIPSGRTYTYGELAKKLKTGPRAIGQACRTNPIAIIIPCHRIVATDHLGGYSGAKSGPFFAAKTWLLKHEGLAF